jgi:hypothetical protein
MIKVIEKPGKCSKLWKKYCNERSIFYDWEYKKICSDAFSLSPFFILNKKHDTLLPCGMVNDSLQFWGGTFYNDKNRVFGNIAGLGEIFDFINKENFRFRLLPWDIDPYPYLPDSMKSTDIPYDQYWMLNRDHAMSYDGYMSRLDKSVNDKANYLGRKFASNIRISHVQKSELNAFFQSLDELFVKQCRTFAARGKKSIYEGQIFREVIKEILEYVAYKHELEQFAFRDAGAIEGLGITINNKTIKQTVYFVILYSQAKSNISNALFVNVIKKTLERGFSLDSMRRSFTLKKKYGLEPVASFALTNDPAWNVIKPVDIDEDEYRKLYGRCYRFDENGSYTLATLE